MRLTYGAAGLSRRIGVAGRGSSHVRSTAYCVGDFGSASTLVSGTILVAAKALSNAYGALLLVEHRGVRIFSVNVATLTCGVLIGGASQRAGGQWDLASAFWVICAIEFVSPPSTRRAFSTRPRCADQLSGAQRMAWFSLSFYGLLCAVAQRCSH